MVTTHRKYTMHFVLCISISIVLLFHTVIMLVSDPPAYISEGRQQRCLTSI